MSHFLENYTNMTLGFPVTNLIKPKMAIDGIIIQTTDKILSYFKTIIFIGGTILIQPSNHVTI